MGSMAVWTRLSALFLICSALVCECAAWQHFSHDVCDDNARNGQRPPRVYNTFGSPVNGKLNVHLVPHSHDDVGWLKTVDQYFIGSNNSIQVAAVQYVIDSVIDALEKDPNRKFIYVEQAFFQRWWRQQSEAKQEFVKELVETGRLEFLNGGWCMHDEASTHYIDMIDQTTLGHRYIKEQFGKTPRIGWQIDPFGHSAVQGYLLSAEVGFDAVFFARADYQDKEKRLQDRSMEFIWRGSKSLGSSAEIFGGLLYNHYSAPEGFSYDISETNPLVQDDPLLYDYNVEERVESFIQAAKEQSESMRTNHILFTMGGDFTYEQANTWYKQMDKLIHYANEDGRINAFYSTPSIYVDAKHAANETWPEKKEDFFPYANCANCYWTGYFSSRPAFKRFARQLTGYLQASRQLEFLVGKQDSGPNTDALEEALAIVQHHDGMSGTEKQHVADDYTKRLFLGALEAAEVINRALSHLVSNTLHVHNEGREQVIKQRHDQGLPKRMLDFASPTRNEETLKFEQCFLLNISYCPYSEIDLSSGKSLVVVAYNALGWTRQETLRIPVIDAALEVTNADGQTISSQLIPLTSIAKNLRDRYVKAYEGTSPSKEHVAILVFQASVPPLGFSTFHIKASPSNGGSDSAVRSTIDEFHHSESDSNVQVQTEKIQMQFSRATGQMQSFTDLQTGADTAIAQSYCWYNASDGDTVESREQAGGAYVFRPNSSTCFPVGNSDGKVPLRVVHGPVVQEVHQEFSSWVSQVVRFHADADHAEVEFLVGPIPIEDSLGKDVVTKLTTQLHNEGGFYTDSNGRDFLKRVRDYRSDWELNVTEPIAGNYYPLNLGVYMVGNETDFSILVDRPLGGASIKDGQLELMLHRRLLHDDNKGVSEVLNETVCFGEDETCQGLTVQGVYYLRVGSKASAAQWRRSMGQRILTPLQLAFSTYEDSGALAAAVSNPKFSTSTNGYELPPNVAVITLQVLADGSALVRLAHLYEVGEADALSSLATVDLKALLGNKKIDKISEMTLTANQKKSEWKPLKWNVEGSAETSPPVRGRRFEEKESWSHSDEVLVELGPQEIRTFQVSFG